MAVPYNVGSLIPFLNANMPGSTESAIIKALVGAGQNPSSPTIGWTSDNTSNNPHASSTVPAGAKFWGEIGSDDTITVTTGPGVVLSTGNGHNVDLIGGFGDDTLVGGTGRDTLTAVFGNNELIAGTGTSILIGGAGYDTLKGGSGHDSLYGGGHSVLQAGSGPTYLEGSHLPGAADTLIGGSGSDTLVSFGDDVLIGGSGNALIKGGSGSDTIFGGTGSDTIKAGNGTEKIVTGSGDDSITAGHGHDTVYVGYNGSGFSDVVYGNHNTVVDINAANPSAPGSSTSVVDHGGGYETVVFTPAGGSTSSVDIHGNVTINYTTSVTVPHV